MVIKEGRYDKITSIIVKDLMTVIKKTKGYPAGDMVSLNLPETLGGDLEYVIERNGVEFSVEINIVREPNNYQVESFKVEDEDVIEVNIVLDPEKEEKQYQKLYYKLQEDVRHELEHVLQDYGIGDRETPTGSQKGDTTYQHHKRPDEVEALLAGFNRKSKLLRIPLQDIMIDDLDEEISKGNLTKGEAEELLHIWTLSAKRRFPKAIYRTE